MVTPKPDMPLLRERPVFRYPGWIRLFGRLAGPVVRPLRRRTRERAERLLSQLMRAAGTCESRTELERFLGPPRYVLVGDLFSSQAPDGKVLVPDKVESYAKGDCVVEIWFRGERVDSITGFVQWSPWDLASGLAR
jgi:hypothetical protein